MEVVFTSAFSKDLSKLKEEGIKTEVMQVIQEIESAVKLSQINNLKFLKGAKDHYRIRIGNYRLGIRKIGTKIYLARIAHRRDIYKLFP